MDLLGDILSSMDKNKRPGLSKADKVLQSKFKDLKILKIYNLSALILKIDTFNFQSNTKK